MVFYILELLDELQAHVLRIRIRFKNRFDTFGFLTVPFEFVFSLWPALQPSEGRHEASTRLRSCQRDYAIQRQAPRRLNLRTEGFLDGPCVLTRGVLSAIPVTLAP